jgi:hypothetical protein
LWLVCSRVDGGCYPGFVLCFSGVDGFFQSSSIPSRSNVSDGCLSPASQPLVSVLALLVDSAPTPVSMASTSKVTHQEATASTSLIDWNFGTDSDEEEGIVWAEEGEDYPWEGDEVFPQTQKEGDNAAVAMFLSGAWPFPQALDGMSRALPPFLRRRVPLPS